MREWLSGGVSPCQGEGRGFESRLALFFVSDGNPVFRVSVFCYLPWSVSGEARRNLICVGVSLYE